MADSTADTLSSLNCGSVDTLSSLNCGSLHLGPAQEIVDLNDALASWRGISRDELLEEGLDKLLSPGSWIYWEVTVEALLEQQGHAWDVALKLRTEQGPQVEVLVNAHRDPDGTRCILFPFSGRLLWERRLLAAQDHARKQQAVIERLEKTERFRQDFINAVAHELQTPMTPIHLGMGVLQHHCGSSAPPEVQRSLEIIRANLDRMSKLNKSIIQSADVAAGRLDMKLQAISLGQFLPEFMQRWRPRHARSGPIGIEVQDAIIPADPDALTTCLENLLDNAVKFSPPDAPINVLAHAGPPVQIIIEDKGRGIEPDRLKGLGRPFAQAHDRAQVTTLGMGLGLHIVAGLMDAQGGRFEIQSEGLGQGTRAILEFPGSQEQKGADEVGPLGKKRHRS